MPKVRDKTYQRLEISRTSIFERNIMTLKGVGAITNDVLKLGKVIELESSSIAICFSYIYLIIDGIII